jgi:hypothetical protein
MARLRRVQALPNEEAEAERSRMVGMRRLRNNSLRQDGMSQCWRGPLLVSKSLTVSEHQRVSQLA